MTPETLADLRREAGLQKADVGARLAERLGFTGRAASEKACYHDIETGQVSPARVRDIVWEALGDVFGRASDQVQDAATVAFQSRPRTSLAFTRPAERLERAESAPAKASPGTAQEADPVRAAFFVDD